jgi:hypothetical protein
MTDAQEPCAQIESLFYRLDNNARREVLAKLISTFSNGGDRKNFQELATDMSHDHRTLVQQKFQLFLQFCQVLASNHKSGNYDARNEYACQTAAKVMELTNGVAGVPFI